MDFVERDADGDDGNEEDAAGVVVVGITNPQDDAQHLEHVEWVEHLEDREQRAERGIGQSAG